MFNKNNFEKKPIKGGTPANENRNIDKVRSEKLSKLQLENECIVLKLDSVEDIKMKKILTRVEL